MPADGSFAEDPHSEQSSSAAATGWCSGWEHSDATGKDPGNADPRWEETGNKMKQATRKLHIMLIWLHEWLYLFDYCWLIVKSLVNSVKFGTFCTFLNKSFIFFLDFCRRFSEATAAFGAGRAGRAAVDFREMWWPRPGEFAATARLHILQVDRHSARNDRVLRWAVGFGDWVEKYRKVGICLEIWWLWCNMPDMSISINPSIPKGLPSALR